MNKTDRELEQIRYLQEVFCVECALREWDSDRINDVIIMKEKKILKRKNEMFDAYLWYQKNKERLEELDRLEFVNR